MACIGIEFMRILHLKKIKNRDDVKFVFTVHENYNFSLWGQIWGKEQWKMMGSLNQDNYPTGYLHIQKLLSSTQVHHPQYAWKAQDQLFVSILAAPNKECKSAIW